jgi:hypothetical protein
MALEPLEERWLLQDYGTMQCLRDVLTNESIRVFGPSASVDGGPWELTSVDGKAILRSEKDDGSEEFAIPSELSRFRLSLDSEGQRLITESGQLASSTRIYNNWLDAQKEMRQSKALQMNVRGYGEFKCEFVWDNMRTSCGDKPVSVWIGFSWVLDFVLGKSAVDKAFRYAGLLRFLLETAGLNELHFQESARSLRSARKRKQAEAEAGEVGESLGTDWLASIPATLLFLEELVSNNKLGGAKDHQDFRKRAEELFRTMLAWPLRDLDALAFALSRTGIEILLRGDEVDKEALEESEETQGHANRLRTSGDVVKA